MAAMHPTLTPEGIRAWRDTPQRRETRKAAFSACLFSEPSLDTLMRWRGHEIWASWTKEDNHLTALLLACSQPISPERILPFLLDHGLDVRARTTSGEGVLHLASMGSCKHRLAWCRALIEAGADLGATTHKGHSPLLVAAKRGAQEIFDDLLARGMIPTPEDQEGIFQTNHASILENFWARFGMTASREERTLHCLRAARESRWHLVRSVMPYGINVDACLDGETLFLMTRQGRKFPADLVEELIYLGADPDQGHPDSGLDLRQLIQKNYPPSNDKGRIGRLLSLDNAIARGAQRRMEEALPQASNPAEAPRILSARF